MADLLREDPGIVVWWGTTVECVSALRRRERQQQLSSTEVDQAIANLTELGESWVEVQATVQVRVQATRALSVHGLHAADSLQLAAALAWRPLPSEGASFVSLDRRLARAAYLEGFNLPIRL